MGISKKGVEEGTQAGSGGAHKNKVKWDLNIKCHNEIITLYASLKNEYEQT